MTNTSDSHATPDDSSKPAGPPRPKRGAFPAPKSEIEKAKPYIPDVGDDDDFPEGDPDRPARTEGEKEG